MSTIMTFEAMSSHSLAGLTVVAIFGLISALALAFICGRAIRLGVKFLLRRDDQDTSTIPEMLFFSTQIGHYAASLVLSNVFITLSEIVAFKWVSNHGVSAGPTCQAQAILIQIGLWGNCYFTVAHGIHTCNSFILRLHQPRWLSSVVTVIGWGIALTAGLGPLNNSSAYGPTGVSCSITSASQMMIFVLEALPVILAAIISTMVYSLIFLVLAGKLGVDGMDRLRKLNLKAQRGQDEFEEYRRFISTIIRTMFWFPVAFVFLLLPLCIVHIINSMGVSVPIASDVFSHVCCSLLGLVNVILLFNTHRVVRPVIDGPQQKSATVATFGNDASGESPVQTRPQSTFLSNQPVTIPSHKQSSPMHKSAASAQHARTDSSPSADSSVGLLQHKNSRKYGQQRAALPHNIVPPAELSRQISDGGPMPQRERSSLRIAVTPASNGMTSPGLVTVSLSPPPPRILSAGERQGQHKSQLPASEKESLIRQTTAAFGKIARKSRLPPALNLPPGLVPPPPLSMQEVANKSATLAMRLGLPPKADSPALSAVLKVDKGKKKASPPPFTPIRKKSKVRRPHVVLEVRPSDVARLSGADKAGLVRSESNSSDSSSASSRYESDTVDNDSDCSQDVSTAVIRPTTIRSLPRTLERDVDEDDADSDSSSDLSDGSLHLQRETMTSVWSPESPLVTDQHLEMESYLAMKELKAKARAMTGQRSADAGLGKKVVPAGPRAPKSARPVKVASQLSARFTKIIAPKWSPTTIKGTDFQMVLAPNDSIV